MSNGEESGKSVFEKLHEASQLVSGVDSNRVGCPSATRDSGRCDIRCRS